VTGSDAVFDNFLQIIFIRGLYRICVTWCHPSPSQVTSKLFCRDIALRNRSIESHTEKERI
jgi:hypothetical protein